MYRKDGVTFVPLTIAILCGLLIAGVAFGVGYVSSERGIGQGSIVGTTMPAGVDFSPVWKAWQVIDEKFVPAAVATSSPVATSTAAENEARVWGMIEGLAGSLNDPYTFFLPPSENQQFADDMSGSFEGVGMEIATKDKVITVVSPLKGSPAERAGIRSGDQILKIDGVSTEGMDVTAAVKKIRGPKDTKVTLTVFRSGWTTVREIAVMRDVITVPIVTTTARNDGVYVIGISTFTANSPELFRAALRQFVETGGNKLVLDLRGNPGGYLDAAVNIASWYLPSGAVVVSEDYAGHQQNLVHRSLGYDIFNDNLKMVILVDHGSASASEILADALHYHGVAKLVGTDTFGKGSVQELVNITADTALKVTVARWLGPDGTPIPRDGIKPDVKVELTDEDIKAGKDPQMDKAIQILNTQ